MTSTLTRTTPLKAKHGCTSKRYATPDAAKNAAAALTEHRSGRFVASDRQCGRCGGFHVSHRKDDAPKDTGFSDAVKLAIRIRAGGGAPEQAACEACGIHLGEHGGQIQHIYARGQGGSKAWLYSTPANGALLCGTPFTGCHGLCERRDPHMNEAGFWRRRNRREKPGGYPVMLHGNGSGITAYLTPDGCYSADAPERRPEAPDFGGGAA